MKNRLLAIIFILGFSCLVWAQQNPSGLLQLTPEESAKILSGFQEYSVRHNAPRTANLRQEAPASHVNLSHLPVVSSQGNMSICGSFAPTYYLGNYYLSVLNGAGRYNPATDASVMISPMWSVHMFRHSGQYQPTGGDTADSIRGLCEQGYLTLAEMPFDGSPLAAYHLPNAGNQKKALTRRFGGYGVTLSDITTPEGLEKLKDALRNGEIFVVSTARIPLNFDQYPNANSALGKDGQSNNNNVFAWPASGETREAHAVTIIGYDDNRRYVNKDGEEASGALLAVNSWGTGWGVKYNGEGGYVWLSYESFQKYGFLSGRCYSMCPGEGGYLPAKTATVTVTADNDYDNPWVDGMSRPWMAGLTFTQNGHELDNPVPANFYLTGLEGNGLTAEIIVDLSGYENLVFTQFGVRLMFGVTHEHLGLLRRIVCQDADDGLLWEKEINSVLKPFSDSSPEFEQFVSAFDEKTGVMPVFYPQTGSFAMGDLNGDGRLDVVASVRQGQEVASNGAEFIQRVFLQKADGSWTARNLGMSLEGVPEVLLVDLDNDGVLDIAASNGCQAKFLKNDGNGNFSVLATVSLCPEENNNCCGFFATADFDNDGKPDFAVMTPEKTLVLRQETPSKYTIYPLGGRCVEPVWAERQGISLAIGDINGDGLTDIVAKGLDRENWSRNYVLYLNSGKLKFTPYRLPLPEANFSSVSIADADQDGCDDILFTGENSQIVILRGRTNADGKFRMPVGVPVDTALVAPYGGNAAWADLDLDGRLEAVVTGTTTGVMSGGGVTDPFGENENAFPLYKMARNYLKILRWDGRKFTDADMELPGSVGFPGPSLLTVKDFDGDGKPDIIHGGSFGYKSVIYAHQGPNRSICGMKYLHNEVDVDGTAPAAPKNLTAKSLGKSQAKLTWASGSTDGAGERFVLRLGTARGKSDVISPENGAFYKSGVTLSHLPAKKLYWAVRAIDAAGQLSDWSSEGSFTPSGTMSAPTPASSLPAENALPECTVTCSSADASQGSVMAPSKRTCGETISLTARANAGWRFSHWESETPMLDRLAITATAAIYENASFVAHFVPDDTKLQVDEKHLALMDDRRNLWFYENPAREIPLFAAATNCTFFALADDTAYFDRIGPRAWNNRLLRALNGNLWFKACSVNFGDSEGMGGYMEQTQKAWGGPGGLAVRYEFETAGNNAYIRRMLSVIHASYSSYPPTDLRDTEDVVFCVLQRNFLLMLTSAGRVRCLGLNDSGQFGSVTPYRYREPAEIQVLPDVTAITAGSGFAAAIDTDGALWTWGDNRKGQLGRSGATCMLPGVVTGLPSKVIAIAAGNNHLVALCEDGSLHLWGDNTFGQLGAANGCPLAGKHVVAVAAAANRTAALDADGNLYLWGDGVTSPAVIDNLRFDTVRCQLVADGRAASLLSTDLGMRTVRANVPVSLQAGSSERATFQYWLVDGERHDENPLTVTIDHEIVIEAVFQLLRPLMTFGEPEIGDTEIAVDVLMQQTEQKYDGVYFAITHSADMPVNNLDFTWPVPRGMVRYDTENKEDNTVTTEFYIYNSSMLFQPDNPMFKLRLGRPEKGGEFFAEWTGTPVFARNLGEVSDEADTGEALSINLEDYALGADADFVRTCLVSIPDAGCFGCLCIPGEAEVQTLAELEELLGVENLRMWSWNGTELIPQEEVQPHCATIFTVAGRSSEFARIYYQPTESEIRLRPGWNLVMLPENAAPAPNEMAAFSVDKAFSVFLQHQGKLQPGKMYWLYVRE